MVNLFPLNPTPIDLAWISVTFFALGLALYSLGRMIWLAMDYRIKSRVARIVALRVFGLGRENIVR